MTLEAESCVRIEQVDYLTSKVESRARIAATTWKEHDWNRYVIKHFIGLRVDVHSHYLERI